MQSAIPVTLFTSDSVTVTAWSEYNKIVRKTERKGAEPVFEHFPGCSLRCRNGQWYIGGHGAPGPKWKPELHEVDPKDRDPSPSPEE